ncbi:hypothetical protein DRQ07_04280 [candidate division KSB1 bacterium]|nr:MAG: hypothetical protein DRQ07_04280 [candidate division KSB1 bacterium]
MRLPIPNEISEKNVAKYIITGQGVNIIFALFTMYSTSSAMSLERKRFFTQHISHSYNKG